MTKLEKIMETSGTPTMGSLAKVLGITFPRLSAIYSKPGTHEGRYNWQALENYILDRIASESDLVSLEHVVSEAVNIDSERRIHKDRSLFKSTFTRSLGEIDIPLRRYPHTDILAHEFLAFKDSDGVFVVVYQTLIQTVLRRVLTPSAYPEYVFADEELFTMSNTQLNHLCYPFPEIRFEVEKRFKLQELLNE